MSDKKFGSDLNVFDNLEKEGDIEPSPIENKPTSIENKPIRESIIGEMIVKDKPLDEFDFSKEDEGEDNKEEEESDQEFEELEVPPPEIEEFSDDEDYESEEEEESDDDLSEIPEVDEEAEEAEEALENDNEDSEVPSDYDGGDGFEEFTEHEIEASVNLNREIDSCSDSDEQDILVIEEVTPDGHLERSFSTNARSITFQMSGAEDDTNSITQSYRQYHDWDSLLNRSYSERDERLLSVSHMSHKSHMSHVSEVSKMSEKEILDSIDIDTVLVETTEYVTEEIDPQTSNVTVVTHTTFTEVRRKT